MGSPIAYRRLPWPNPPGRVRVIASTLPKFFSRTRASQRLHKKTSAPSGASYRQVGSLVSWHREQVLGLSPTKVPFRALSRMTGYLGASFHGSGGRSDGGSTRGGTNCLPFRPLCLRSFMDARLRFLIRCDSARISSSHRATGMLFRTSRHPPCIRRCSCGSAEPKGLLQIGQLVGTSSRCEGPGSTRWRLLMYGEFLVRP